MEAPIVQIKHGKLKGKVSKTSNDHQFYTFKGVPYAKPPVGELRFSITQPPESWEGVRDATKNCNICAQLDTATRTVVGDEDCLYLNVYTPKLPSVGLELLPVIVFLHGGGFVFGHGTDDLAHGPDYLIEKNVVVVSINYRLGILGFLSLDRRDAPGNMGLMDQVQALKWVQDNIADFGGNPNNVTLFGVSAGAASAEYLVLSPMAKGLFHKVIAASGSSLLQWAHNTDVRKLALKIPSVNGKTITDDDVLLKYLKSLSTNELVTDSMKALAIDKFRGGIHFGFVPVIEKSGDWEPFLTKSPYQLLVQGEFNKVPYMTGFCSREGILMAALGVPTLEKLINEKCFIDHLPFDVDNTEKSDMELKIKNIYLKGDQFKQDGDDYAMDFFTDVDFLGGVYVAAKLITKHSSPVFLYEFAYDGNLNYIKKTRNIKLKGACHGDDGGYLIKSNQLTDALTDVDKSIRDKMTTMWTNFAKYGDPTPIVDNIITTKWEPISNTNDACLVIDETTEMKYEVYPERMALYEELYEMKFGAK